MIILTHVLIALASMAFTTYLYVSPSKNKLLVSYGLIAMTIASGTYLIVTTPGHMLESCTMGLLYLAVVSVGTVAARKKLAQPTL